MIEIYSQEFDGVTFTVALDKCEILTSTFRVDQKDALNMVLDILPFRVPFQVFHEPTTYAKTVLATLKDIYDGKDTNTNLPLATSRLSSFTKKVLKATTIIPVGYVTSYGAIAEVVGGGARAVGNAMACNRFPLVVPCHRVVKSDLSLGGYGLGGLNVKYALLNRERRGYTELKTVAVCGSQLKVVPVEHVLAKFV